MILIITCNIKFLKIIWKHIRQILHTILTTLSFQKNSIVVSILTNRCVDLVWIIVFLNDKCEFKTIRKFHNKL